MFSSRFFRSKIPARMVATINFSWHISLLVSLMIMLRFAGPTCQRIFVDGDLSWSFGYFTGSQVLLLFYAPAIPTPTNNFCFIQFCSFLQSIQSALHHIAFQTEIQMIHAIQISSLLPSRLCFYFQNLNSFESFRGFASCCILWKRKNYNHYNALKLFISICRDGK